MISKLNQLMVIVMNLENDINFEDMDDLALPDHIEWSDEQPEEFSLDALEFMQL